ncbi:chromodomain Y-like protein [Sorex fumeus]|uniref:chromodomain Y-like protein n=1 Tax=Sorex fumeus TaxID=62283 RepID=UPI0024AE8607|nr:chromodomain Y-like protein [Sorex fumeus]XP_055993304.1 chromodomain Y-like protein [Sorex fumeus]
MDSEQLFEVERIAGERKSLGVDPEGHSEKTAEALKSFVNHFIHFQKPIVAAVHGPAVGLGASILGLCDIVLSSDKACFQTPYATQGQTPDGCSSLTFPMIMGGTTASEMLLSGWKLTAKEPCHKGLISQVFNPDTFMREVMDQVKLLASYHPLVLQECKSLIGCSVKAELEQANIKECETLKSIWAPSHASQFMLQFLDRKLDLSDL